MTTEKKPDISFSDAFCKHKGNVADKWEGYLRVYDRVLEDKKSQCKDFLEIGVNNGGSLEVFAEYFDKSQSVIGLDINPNCKKISFKDDRIKVIIGDSNSTAAKQLLTRTVESFDLILDDGSHQSKDIVDTFLNLSGLVSPGGRYIIEDLCCSYWQEFGGGVNTNSSAIGFLKRLIDIINSEHWNTSYSINNYLTDCGFPSIPPDSLTRLKTVESIHFYNSICVIDFAKTSSEATIGPRICRGTTTPLGEGSPVNGQSIKEVGADQSNNPFNTSEGLNNN